MIYALILLDLKPNQIPNFQPNFSSGFQITYRTRWQSWNRTAEIVSSLAALNQMIINTKIQIRKWNGNEWPIRYVDTSSIKTKKKNKLQNGYKQWRMQRYRCDSSPLATSKFIRHHLYKTPEMIEYDLKVYQ